MKSRWRRAVLVGLAGALAGGAFFAAGVRARAGFTIELDRRLPAFFSGFHPDERHGDETFAWTSGEAAVVFDGLDRRAAWQCAVRLRSGRPEALAPPTVTLSVDGRPALTRVAPAGYQDFTVGVPADGTRRLTLTIASPTFNPGPPDDRILGVQVDRISCRPTGGILPAAGATAAVAIASAALGACFGAVGVPFWGALALTLLVAALQATPLGLAPALYGGYAGQAATLAGVVALSAMVFQHIAQRWTGSAWQTPACTALALSAAALYVKLVALLHPSKPFIDAVFHAHRLDWVLGGRFFFTQPIQDAVQFPYAIGLYLCAAPWSLLTDDHVELLRIVVTASETVAGGLLYLMVARAWQDRWAGAAAVALFHLVPIAFVVVGNANQTNAFGQSAALVTIAAATIWPLDRRHVRHLAGLTALATLAFLSHVSTAALLGVTLGAIGVAGLWRAFRRAGAPALSILVATAAAAALARVLYYGHFPEVHRMFAGARTPAAAAVPEAGAAATNEPAPQVPSVGVRGAVALRLGVHDVGWPILLLAAIGLWRVAGERRVDRLTLTLVGWGAAYVVFIAAGTLSPVESRYQRYAVEFISRVNFALYPAAVILAGRGGLWLWRTGWAGRLTACGLGLAAARLAFQYWARWL